MLAQLQTNFGNMHMQKCRYITNCNLTIFNQRGYSFGISDIDLAERASSLIMTVDYFLSICHDVAGDVDNILQ